MCDDGAASQVRLGETRHKSPHYAELHILNGHRAEDEDHEGFADDGVSVIPASGKGGFKDPKLCIPNAGDILAAGWSTTRSAILGGDILADRSCR